MRHRAILSLGAALALWLLGGASLALAAGPAGTLGAALATDANIIQVQSRATVPTIVTLSVSGAFTLSRDRFAMAPGEVISVPYTGTGKGEVTARMVPANATGESGAIVLSDHLRYVTSPPPFDPWSLLPAVALAGTALLLAGAFLVSRRISR